MTRIVVDSGPLVAYFNRRDRWHRWATDQMAALNPPLVTCEPVLTEACFLIQRAGGKPVDLIRKIAQRSLVIGIDLEQDASGTESLMQRYVDTPLSLAMRVWSGSPSEFRTADCSRSIATSSTTVATVDRSFRSCVHRARQSDSSEARRKWESGARSAGSAAAANPSICVRPNFLSRSR